MGGFRHGNSVGVFLLAASLLPACAPQPGSPSLVTTTAPPSLTAPLSSSPLPLNEAAFTPSPFLARTPTPTPTLTLTPSPTFLPSPLCSPLDGYTLTELPQIESQPFIAPRPGKDDGHHGVDFAHWQYKDRVTLEGVAVQAVLPGEVAGFSVEKYPYGNMIMVETPFEFLSPEVIAAFQIQSGQSLYLLYAHLQAPSLFQPGESVDCGETIGKVGNSGASGNPHLHLETRVGPAGITFASMEYYKTTSTDEERANYESWRFSGEFILYDPWMLLKVRSAPSSVFSLPFFLSSLETEPTSQEILKPQKK